MAKKKKPHASNEQKIFEQFLDHIEDSDVENINAAASNRQKKESSEVLEGQSSLVLLLAKLSIVTVIIISLMMWFVWPKMSDKDINPKYQALLGQISARIQLIEQQLDKQTTEVGDRVQTGQSIFVAQADQAASIVSQPAQRDTAHEIEILGLTTPKNPSVKAATKQPPATASLTHIQPVAEMKKTAEIIIKTPTLIRPGEVFRIHVNIANVRAAPVSGSRIVMKLKQGTKVVVLKQQGEWFQVRLMHKSPGWIFHTLLKKNVENDEIL